MRFILGVVIAAVVWFVWGFVFWTVIPYQKSVLKPLPGGEAVAKVLQASGLETGVYILPGGDPMNDEAAKARFESGPIATLMYQKEGKNPADTKVFLHGLLHMLGSAFLLAIVIATAGRRTFFGRYMLVIWIGLFVAIWAEMSDVIWFSFPLEYACLAQTYHVSSLLIVGAILAFFVRPPTNSQLD